MKSYLYTSLVYLLQQVRNSLVNALTNEDKDIPVVILCGGLGTRLGTETVSKPKPMVEIGGKPILWHVMKIYSYWGYNNFILSMGYQSDKIKQYFMFYKEYSNNFEINMNTGKYEYLDELETVDWNVKLVDTGIDTLKGGRIKRIEKYVNTDRFMLTYGDGVGDIDINKLLKFHKSHRKLSTLTGVHPPSRFGEIIHKGTEIISFSEKPQASMGLINGGFMVHEAELFDHLSSDVNADFEIGPLEDLAGKGRIQIYKHLGTWACMDNVRDMNYLNKLWNNNEAFWKLWK